MRNSEMRGGSRGRVFASGAKISVLLGVAALMTGCGDPEYTRYCVESSTMERVDDDKCEDQNNLKYNEKAKALVPGQTDERDQAYQWYYVEDDGKKRNISPGSSVYGGGSFNPPADGEVRAPADSGGAVVHGGFGRKGGGSSGG